MATFEGAIGVVMQKEGGYSHNPHDPGGETKFGISHRAYPNVDITTLTLQDAEAIIKANYWRFDGINDQAIATKLLDMSVNLGLSEAVRLLQMALNDLGSHLAVDGVFGSNSCSTCNGSDPVAVHRELQTHQQSYYVTLVAQNPTLFTFLHGWLHRANTV
jgi:lysozyme family protein